MTKTFTARRLLRLGALGCMLIALWLMPLATPPVAASDCYSEYQACDDACYYEVYLPCLDEGYTPSICYYPYNQCRVACQAVFYECLLG